VRLRAAAFGAALVVPLAAAALDGIVEKQGEAIRAFLAR
jgi:hypothetical protein